MILRVPPYLGAPPVDVTDDCVVAVHVTVGVTIVVEVTVLVTVLVAVSLAQPNSSNVLITMINSKHNINFFTFIAP